MMKKVLAAAAMMSIALVVAAGGALAEADVSILDTIEIVSIEETSPVLCNVVFYDFSGVEFAAMQVQAGSAIAEPDTVPLAADGSAFQHWYDSADEWKTAFDFTQVIYGDIALYPYSAQAADSILNAGDTATQPESDASLILINPVVVETAPVQYTPESILTTPETSYVAPEAQTNDPVMTIDQLFGGNAPAETQPVQQAPTDYNANSILTINEILDTPVAAPAADTTQRAAVEQNAVNDILNAQQPTNDLVTFDDYDVPMAAPVAAPSVEVVCEYTGELKAGTPVTVRAVIHNLPSDSIVSYQWQNDATGTFQDVVGATGETFTFLVDEYSAAGCNWRVNVELSA